MTSLITSGQATFAEDARRLDIHASQLRQATQLYKGMGLASGVLGGVGLLATGLAVVPLAGGAAMWAIASLREAKVTGRFMPIPFSDSSGTAMMAGATGEAQTGQDIAITEYDYLPSNLKAEYTLRTVLAPVVGNMLEGVTDDTEVEVLLAAAKRTLLKYFPLIVDDPEMFSRAQFGGEQNFQHHFAHQLPQAVQLRLSPALLEELPETLETLGAVIEQPEILEAEVTVEPEPPATPEPVAKTVKTAFGELLKNPFESSFFLGGQRTGKTRLATDLAKAAKNIDVYHLNLSSWGTEDAAYTAMAKEAVANDLMAMEKFAAENVILDAIDMVEKFNGSTRPSILIVDEWCELAAKANTYATELTPLVTLLAALMNRLGNTGVKRQKAIYAIAPKFRAGDLVQSGLAVKSLRCVLVAIAPGAEVVVEGVPVVFSEPAFEDGWRNFAGVAAKNRPVGRYGDKRIALYNGAWLPVGLSGDKVKPEPKAPKTKKAMPDTATLASLEKSLETKALTATEAKVVALAKTNGPITPKDAYKLGGSFRTAGVDGIAQMFRDIAGKGHGSLEGTGSGLTLTT